MPGAAGASRVGIPMTIERALLAAGWLLGCTACGNYQPHQVSTGQREPRLSEISELSESEAWDAALDDARDAWSRSSAGGPRVAIRFETSTDTRSFAGPSNQNGIHAHAFIDGSAIDSLSEPMLGDGSQLMGVKAVDSGRHSLRASIESADGRILIDKTLSFDGDDSHDLLLRAMVSNEGESSYGWRLDIAPLVVRRISVRERADRDVERIDAELRMIRLQLAGDRSSLDAKSMHCVNDGFSQMFVAKRVSDELHADLATAPPEDFSRAAQIASRITLQRRHVSKLSRDSQACAHPSSTLVAMVIR